MLLEALVDGRLHLTSLILLRPHLTENNLNELVAEATHRSREEIEWLLARRFPRADVPTSLTPVPPEPPAGPPAPALLATTPMTELRQLLSPATVVAGNDLPDKGAESGPRSIGSDLETPAPAVVPPARSRARLTPLSTDRVELTVTIARTTREKLRRAQELLGHRVAPGDVAAVLDRALDVLIRLEQKRKYAETDQPRAPRERREGSRAIPANVRRAVRERDQDQCAYVSPEGKRCEERKGLEFHHLEPYARRGGETVDNLCLRCWTHNQYEAEQVYGSRFMANKRTQTRCSA